MAQQVYPTGGYPQQQGYPAQQGGYPQQQGFPAQPTAQPYPQGGYAQPHPQGGYAPQQQPHPSQQWGGPPPQGGPGAAPPGAPMGPQYLFPPAYNTLIETGGQSGYPPIAQDNLGYPPPKVSEQIVNSKFLRRILIQFEMILNPLGLPHTTIFLIARAHSDEDIRLVVLKQLHSL